MLKLIAPIAILSGLTFAAPAIAQTQVEIKEWQVEWEKSRPRDPFAVSKDEVWFVGQQGHYLAKLDVPTRAAATAYAFRHRLV